MSRHSTCATRCCLRRSLTAHLPSTPSCGAAGPWPAQHPRCRASNRPFHGAARGEPPRPSDTSPVGTAAGVAAAVATNKVSSTPIVLESCLESSILVLFIISFHGAHCLRKIRKPQNHNFDKGQKDSLVCASPPWRAGAGVASWRGMRGVLGAGRAGKSERRASGGAPTSAVYPAAFQLSVLLGCVFRFNLEHQASEDSSSVPEPTSAGGGAAHGPPARLLFVPSAPP